MFRRRRSADDFAEEIKSHIELQADALESEGGLRSDLWIPVGMDSQISGSERIKYRDVLWLNVLGKLKPGVNHRQAENELNSLVQHLADRFPDAHKGPNTISSDPLWRSPFGLNVYLYGTLPILFALALVLLLLACANLANLLLVRSVARRREFAVRFSIEELAGG